MGRQASSIATKEQTLVAHIFHSFAPRSYLSPIALDPSTTIYS